MLVIGHRGASAVERENSVAAFERAAEMGADGVELDVRLDGAGRLIVAHDPLPVEVDADLVDLVDGTLIDLDAALGACADMLVNVEIKNSVGDGGFDPMLTIVDPVLAALRRHDPSGRRWLVSSFSWATVQACRSAAPEIATAWLCHGIDAAGARVVAQAGHTAVHPWERTVTAATVAACHDAGLAVTTWTCNDPDRIAELAAFGVDAVCTDVPDVALDTLGVEASAATSSSRRPARWGRPA